MGSNHAYIRDLICSVMHESRASKGTLTSLSKAERVKHNRVADGRRPCIHHSLDMHCDSKGTLTSLSKAERVMSWRGVPCRVWARRSSPLAV